MTAESASIEDYEAWAFRMAHAMLGDDLHLGTCMDWQDLGQEAMIGAWQADLAYDPERSPNKTAFTKWKARGAAHDAIRAREKHVVYSIRDDEDALALLQSEDPDVFDRVLGAYHAGEIAQALDCLTPAQRKYVIARFWQGLEGKELKDLFGYEPHSLWTSKKNGAKYKLAKALAHLANA